MNNLKEILNYELYTKYNCFYLVIPAKDLRNISFVLKDNDLFILLNQVKCYVIRHLPEEVIEKISLQQAYLVEKLTFIQHKIELFDVNSS